MAGISFHVHTGGLDNIQKQIAEGCTKAEHAVSAQAAKDTAQYVPMRSGSLRERTRVIGNRIIYPGPYARYLYYGKYMVDAETGKGPMHFEDKTGEHIKYRKGARLVPTDRDLVFHSPNTRSHWFEYSKAKNMDKWMRIAKETGRNGR